jgi:hypothetical protein
VWSSLLLLGAVALAQASADVPGGDLAARVERLVRQLDAPQLAERNAAEEELATLGPDILRLLPQTAHALSAEAELRLARIRLKLQQAQAAASLQPSRVTLHGEAMPLAKILAAIQEQTGNRIVDARPQATARLSDPKLKVDFHEVPFWRALDQVLDQAGLTIYPFGDDHAARAVPAVAAEALRSGRASYAGPFRFEVTSVLAQRDLRRAAQSGTGPIGRRAIGVLRLELEVAWEPRLRPIVFRQRLADVRAIDDRGEPLGVLSSQADLEVPVEPGPIAKVLSIPLALPPREVRKIARLEGTLEALVPGKPEGFRFQNLAGAKNVEQRIAGATVLLEQVRKAPKGWEVQILLRFDRTEGALQSHRNWVLRNPAFLQGRDGKRIAPVPSPETTQRDASAVGIRYVFADQGPLDQYAFVYETPTAIFSLALEYEIKDVPLP